MGRPKPNLLLPREIRIKTLGCQPGWNVIEIGLSFIFQIMSSLLPTNSGWRVNPSPFRTRFAHNVFFLTLHKLVTVKKAHFSILFYLCQCNDRLLSMTRALKSPSVLDKWAPGGSSLRSLIYWEKCGTHNWTYKKGNIHIGKNQVSNLHLVKSRKWRKPHKMPQNENIKVSLLVCLLDSISTIVNSDFRWISVLSGSRWLLVFSSLVFESLLRTEKSDQAQAHSKEITFGWLLNQHTLVYAWFHTLKLTILTESKPSKKLWCWWQKMQ